MTIEQLHLILLYIKTCTLVNVCLQEGNPVEMLEAMNKADNIQSQLEELCDVN